MPSPVQSPRLLEILLKTLTLLRFGGKISPEDSQAIKQNLELWYIAAGDTDVAEDALADAFLGFLDELGSPDEDTRTDDDDMEDTDLDYDE